MIVAAGLILLGWFLPLLMTKTHSFASAKSVCESRQEAMHDAGKTSSHFLVYHSWNFATAFVLVAILIVDAIGNPVDELPSKEAKVLDRKCKRLS
jgi:hypothetical protein